MKILLLSLVFILSAGAADLTPEFRENYELGSFSEEEIETLKNNEVILIPGIMSETFIWNDRRSRVDFSIITKDYFGSHLRYLQSLGIPSQRLLASSASVEETRKQVSAILSQATRPVLFFTHSLGGMALLDHLLEHREHWDLISGIVFLQSPFTGAPAATVVKRFPLLAKLFPLVHTSTEVVNYLSLENRTEYVTKNEEALRELTTKIRVITVAGVANGYRSLFSPSVTMIRSGCLKLIRGRCVGKRVYRGPYDLSDGMVPLEGSKLPGTDYVILEGADHGETVVMTPFRGYDHRRLTAALLKLML